MAERKLIVELIGDSRSLEKAFGRSSSAANKFNRDIGRSTRGIVAGSGAFRSLGRSIAFASGGFLAGAGIASAIHGAFSELASANKVAADTAAVLKSTGNAANTSAKQIDAMADALLRKTGIDDEQIKQGFNLLATFTNIRNEAGRGNRVFDQAGKAALDLSVRFGTDLRSAAIQVGKALNDPVKGITALRRAGVSFTEAQQKQIKALVDSGQLLRAQKIILAELRVETGGAAAAAGRVAPWNLLRESVRNLSAELLRGFLPSLRQGIAFLQKQVDAFANNREAQKRFAANIRSIAGTIKGIVVQINNIVQALGGWKVALEFIIAAKVIGGLASVAKAFVAIRVAALSAAGAEGLLALMPFLGPFGLIAVGTTAMAAVVIANWDQMLAGVQQYTIGLDGVARKTVETQDEIFANMIRRARQAGSVGPSGPIGQGGNPAAAPFTGRGPRDRSFAPRFGFGRTADERAQDAQDLADRRRRARMVRRLSLQAQLARAELAVAKASLTRTQKDDRAALKVEADVLRAQIASHKKAFRDKTALYNQLAAVLGQIQSIDQAARDKQRAAAKKARDAAAAAAKQAREEAKRLADEFKQTVSEIRDRIGALFSGPVFEPTDAQRKRALGAPTPGANAKLLVADLKAQIQQFKAFENDLKRLAKRGAPAELLAELRQQGLAVAPQVHALATAGAGTFAEFKRLFIRRERLAVDVAKEIRPVVNLTVIVDKDSGKVTVKTTPTTQKRGRHPGVPFNQSSLSFGPH